jgi:hypothetical protein
MNHHSFTISTCHEAIFQTNNAGVQRGKLIYRDFLKNLTSKYANLVDKHDEPICII